MPVLAPRVLGGCGSVNIMTYARGMEEDFKGWLWPKEEMVGILKKVG
jgi:choline dehydrogenase-like flavoprotein